MEPLSIAGIIVLTVVAGAIFSSLCREKSCCGALQKSPCRPAAVPEEAKTVEPVKEVKEVKEVEEVKAARPMAIDADKEKAINDLINDSNRKR